VAIAPPGIASAIVLYPAVPAPGFYYPLSGMFPDRPWTPMNSIIGFSEILIERLGEIGDVRRRDALASPDGGVIADFLGEVGDPAELAARLSAVPGVVDHGLFPASMVSDVLIGRGGDVERLTIT